MYLFIHQRYENPASTYNFRGGLGLGGMLLVDDLLELLLIPVLHGITLRYKTHSYNKQNSIQGLLGVRTLIAGIGINIDFCRLSSDGQIVGELAIVACKGTKEERRKKKERLRSEFHKLQMLVQTFAALILCKEGAQDGLWISTFLDLLLEHRLEELVQQLGSLLLGISLPSRRKEERAEESMKE